MGATEQWDRDPSTGDYIMLNGAPSPTDSLTIPAFIRCKTEQHGWLYAPDSAFGSAVRLVQKTGGTHAATSREIEHCIAAALQPLIDDGRADSVTVTLIAVSRSGELVTIDIVDAQGNPQSITFRPVGG